VNSVCTQKRITAKLQKNVHGARGIVRKVESGHDYRPSVQLGTALAFTDASHDSLAQIHILCAILRVATVAHHGSVDSRVPPDVEDDECSSHRWSCSHTHRIAVVTCPRHIRVDGGGVIAVAQLLAHVVHEGSEPDARAL